MNKKQAFAMSLIAMATMAGCNSLPANNAALEQARSDYRVAQDNPQARDLAGGELKLAGDALTKANDAWTRGDKTDQVNHLAYLAKQKVAIAQEKAKQKAAEMAVTNADSQRDKVRLAARTNEAEQAQRDSAAAQRDASYAQARTAQLEAQLRDLNAQKTARGLVITIGDVFFDTDRAELKVAGAQIAQKLAAFLNEYPQRKVLIEGFTDSTGSESHNLTLSAQRANTIRTALMNMGVGSERILTLGFGEAYPVAGNESSAGRQLNRRVEIIVSDDTGSIAAR